MRNKTRKSRQPRPLFAVRRDGTQAVPSKADLKATGARFALSCTAILCALGAMSTYGAAAQTPVPIASATAGATPQGRLQEAWWKKRHEAVIQQGKQHPDTDLLWIGDSITNNFEKSTLPDENFQPTWQEFYAPRKALNLGFSGDTTANLLWRLQHGEVANLHPRAVVLLIGTNNTGAAQQSPVETEVGIDAVVAELEHRLPASKILLLGLLPSAISAKKTADDAMINRYLSATYAENAQVTYLDAGSVLLKGGVLETKLFYDPRLPGHLPALHPDTVGQRRMAEAIEPTLAKLMEAPPAVPLTAMTDINTALIPVSRLELDSYDWFARHHAELQVRHTMQPQIVMVGDSITHFWGGAPYGTQARGPAAWAELFGNTPVINMGFGWDRIQNVLWRVEHGEFDGLAPATVVINIGTNNLTGTEHARANTPAEVVEGIGQLCSALHQRSPKSHIVLMGIFPRNDSPNDPLRGPIHEVNAQLARIYAHEPGVRFVDIGNQFVRADGTLRRDLMPDGTHPNEAGYRIWAEALRVALHF